jgi:hypothetical protein
MNRQIIQIDQELAQIDEAYDQYNELHGPAAY